MCKYFKTVRQWHWQNFGKDWECVISEIIGSLLKSHFSEENIFVEEIFFSKTNYNPTRNPTAVQGQYLFSPPHPYLPIAVFRSLHAFSITWREGLFQRAKNRKTKWRAHPSFRKLAIQGQHLFSTGTILKFQKHHWQKAFETCSSGYTIICSAVLWNFFLFVSPKYIDAVL